MKFKVLGLFFLENIYKKKYDSIIKQDEMGIQNMSRVYLIVRDFIKWKQLESFWDGVNKMG